MNLSIVFRIICYFKGHKFPKEWRFGPTASSEKTCKRCGKISRCGRVLKGW